MSAPTTEPIPGQVFVVNGRPEFFDGGAVAPFGATAESGHPVTPA